MIVVDTNIIVYLYLAGERSRQSEELLSHDSDWAAPLLWRSEFRNVLTHYLRKKLLTLHDIMLIIEEAESLMLGNEYEVSSAQIMPLADLSGCSAYDCEFVALAKSLNVPLVTADQKILREFPDTAKAAEIFLG